ncbi:hypothetical protein K502DRAFT_329596 [Neoconidiobolus thromboides FSU 785]|nr:hypothetical protein K502DRAFT_329596 [Neoconidiobolus thromboides FSU 785]
MGFIKLKKFFGNKNNKLDGDTTIIGRSKSLRLVRSHQTEQIIENNTIIYAEPSPSSVPPSPAAPSFNQKLTREERGSFVKAVNTVKKLSHSNSEAAFSAFFPENVCQKRAIFMLVHLKKQVFCPLLNSKSPNLIAPLLATIGDRLFTLFYIIKVLKPGEVRSTAMAEAQNLVKASGLNPQICGTRETAFAVYFALQTINNSFFMDDELKGKVLEKSNECLKSCIEKELKLSESEKESMYVFQQVMSGFHFTTPKLLLDEYSEKAQN